MTKEGMTRAGIVDKVRAVRNDTSGDVVRLEATVRIETSFERAWGGKMYADEIVVSLEPTSNVNPGNIVGINIMFDDPMGQRFQPALETSTVDEDGEVLDVMVEDGMKG